MKLDALNNIQLDSVHLGRERIKNIDNIIILHKGSHVSPSYMKNLRQLNDLFSVAEVCVITDIIQYFIDNNIKYKHVLFCLDSILLFYLKMSEPWPKLFIQEITIIR